MLNGIIAVIIAYLLGSIPFAYIITRWRKGVDIRTIGVKNVGAANVGREIGLLEGLAVGALDSAKGAAAILIAFMLQLTALWIGAVGIAVILGHAFPVFLGFKGGKGAATTIGIFLVLTPVPMLIDLVLLIILYIFIRKIFIVNCFVFPALSLLIWLIEGNATLALYALGITIFMAMHGEDCEGTVKEIAGIPILLLFRFRSINRSVCCSSLKLVTSQILPISFILPSFIPAKLGSMM
jgi:glycerol-3-phosphate acyltransferase PlsY